MKKLIIISSIVVALLIVLVIGRIISKSKEKNIVDTSKVIAVKTATAYLGSIEGALSYTGNVEGVHEATILSQTAGVVTKVNMQVGKKCSIGQVLAVVRNLEQTAAVEQAKAQLLAAKNKLDKAEVDLKRTQNLFNQKVATQDNLEMAQLNIKAAQAEVKGAEAALKVAQKQLDDTYIKATINGYISSKDIDVGATLAPGVKIAHLVDISQFKIKIMVAENDAVKLHEGKEVSVKVDALPGKIFTGQVNNIGLNTQDGFRSYPVEVLIKGQRENEIKSGMFARCEINTGRKDNVIIIPETAVTINSDGSATVFVVQNNKAVSRKVTLGINSNGKYEIVSGLNVNEKVITDGKDRVLNGSDIKESAQ